LNANGKVDRTLLKVTVAQLSTSSTDFAPHRQENKCSDLAASAATMGFTPRTSHDAIAALPNQVSCVRGEYAMVSDPELSSRISEFKFGTPETWLEVKASSTPSLDFDLEKEALSRSSDLDLSSPSAGGSQNLAVLPEVEGSPTLSWLRHRLFIAYRWLLLPIAGANIAVAC
jgi:hypothetical protein